MLRLRLRVHPQRTEAAVPALLDLVTFQGTNPAPQVPRRSMSRPLVAQLLVALLQHVALTCLVRHERMRLQRAALQLEEIHQAPLQALEALIHLQPQLQPTHHDIQETETAMQQLAHPHLRTQEGEMKMVLQAQLTAEALPRILLVDQNINVLVVPE